MSLEMITWALKRNMKNSQFQVLIAIANEANSDGICFTTPSELAYKANVTDRVLRSCINQLRTMGLIDIEHRHTSHTQEPATAVITLHPEVKDYEKAPYPNEEDDHI